MPTREQQSSILSEQELHLLASPSHQQIQNSIRVYSYQYKARLNEEPLYLAYSIKQLVFMLDTSPRGVVLILPDFIESEPAQALTKLITLLTHRNDILVFWIGKMPSMETDIPIFIHCSSDAQLQEKIDAWHSRLEYLFKEWLADYSVAFITDEANYPHQQNLKKIGLLNVTYFNGLFSLSSFNKPKLLIINLDTPELHLLTLLKTLSNEEWFPIIIIYGEISQNLCHATYTLIENNGFPVLAALNEIPRKKEWEQLFSSLFSKVYLKHWINDEKIEQGVCKLYSLETNTINAHFCVYGVTLEQVAALPKTPFASYIISAKSIRDWFPDNIQSGIRDALASEIQCTPSQLDICIENPEEILSTSVFFSTLVMLRLAKTKVYWQVKSEKNLLIEFLKGFPISDVILSEPLSLALLNDPSEALLTFIEQAQLQQINIVVRVAPSENTQEAFALYGIDSVISK